MTPIRSFTHQCLLAESLVADHSGGLGLVRRGLAHLLDVVVAQHHRQPRHLLGRHAENGSIDEGCVNKMHSV